MAASFLTTAHIYGMPIKKTIGGQGLKEPGRIGARAYVIRQRGLSRKGAFARRRRYGQADERDPWVACASLPTLPRCEVNDFSERSLSLMGRGRPPSSRTLKPLRRAPINERRGAVIRAVLPIKIIEQPPTYRLVLCAREAKEIKHARTIRQ